MAASNRSPYRQAFVGWGNQFNTLKVVQSEGRLVVTLNVLGFWSLVFASVMGALVIPFLLLYHWNKVRDGRWWEIGLVALFVVFCWYLLIGQVLRRRRLEVSHGDGSIQFFRGQGGEAEFRLQRQELAYFEIKGWILYAVTKAGMRVPLCHSVEKKILRGLIEDLAKATGVAPVEDAR